jgi:hypothetical protein
MQCRISHRRLPNMESMGDDRMSRYPRTRNRPMVCLVDIHWRFLQTYLSSAISWQSVIPQGLVWSSDWNLACMVSMGKRTGSQSGDGEDVGIHAGCEKRRIWMKNERKQTLIHEASEPFYGCVVLALLQCTTGRIEQCHRSMGLKLCDLILSQKDENNFVMMVIRTGQQLYEMRALHE